MSEYKVEQLLHGYRRGHEQLAGSVKLTTRDADLITRLSDLSGSLAGAPRFTSYLTIYPLPSGKYFALAKTWPDPDAARSGCVLTHTLLVPVSIWATLEEPYVLDELFHRPSSRSSHEYNSAVAVPEIQPLVSLKATNTDHNVLLRFVNSFFCEGRTPIVWFEQDRPEEILWLLLRSLWPRLRATFSACTFCLQPRVLDDRPFELMFAPSEVYPRFQKIKPNHFIDAAADRVNDQRSVKVEAWCNSLEKQVFERTEVGSILAPDLWRELEDDPTAIRRLFLIQELTTAENSVPQVFVGAMDLVESLAKSRDSAVASKLQVAERAVRAARETDDTANGLESLHLIEDRLRRASFSRVQSKIGPVLLDSAAMLTRSFPEITAKYIGLSPAETDLKESWLGRGLLQGFRILAQEDPDKLLVLMTIPAIVRHFLTVEPQLGAIFIRSAAAQRSDKRARSNLMQWLEEIHDPEVRGALRASLLPNLNSNDVDILTELLKDLRAEEVEATLDALWDRTNEFEKSEISELVIEQIAYGYPSQARDWTLRLPRWTLIVAHIFASTYPLTRQGMLELLDDVDKLHHRESAEAVAAFLQRLGSDHLPYWLMELARGRGSLLSTLLCVEAGPSATTLEQTKRLLDQMQNLPVAHWATLSEQVIASSNLPFFDKLRDLAMRSLISGFVDGIVSQSAVRAFQEHPVIVPWFHKVESRELTSPLIRGASATASCINAWQWLAIAPNGFYAREPAFLSGLIDVLLRAHGSNWPVKVSEVWLQILRRARSQSRDKRTAILLCVQALKFSFDNPHLPLGPLVADAFYDVYSVVTSSTFSAETAQLFSILNWDKGKELRRELVSCFIRSKWPPGYLALAVAEVSLLRKVFKRILKMKSGERYARSVLADLRKRPEANATTLSHALQDMLTNPNFYEDWL